MGNLKKRFGRLVAAHRRRVGWTQHQLAEAADMSDDMIARIEVGATGASFTTVEKLATAFDVDPAELFTAELPNGSLQRGPLPELVSKLAGLRKEEIVWLGGIVDAALTPKR